MIRENQPTVVMSIISLRLLSAFIPLNANEVGFGKYIIIIIRTAIVTLMLAHQSYIEMDRNHILQLALTDTTLIVKVPFVSTASIRLSEFQ